MDRSLGRRDDGHDEECGTRLSAVLNRAELFLFFAVLPDEAIQPSIDAVLEGIRRAHGLTGRAIEPMHRHVTLRPIGPDVGDMAVRAMQVAEDIRFQPFAVSMGEVMSFTGRTNHPLVLVDDEGTGGFRELQAEMRRAMKRVGFRQAGDREPHMTLSYDRRLAHPVAVGPIRWTVRDFVLIRRDRGQTQHEVLARWPARAA